MNVEGLNIYHIKSHLQVTFRYTIWLKSYWSLNIYSISTDLFEEYDLQKYRLAKNVPELKHGKDNVAKQSSFWFFYTCFSSSSFKLYLPSKNPTLSLLQTLRLNLFFFSSKCNIKRQLLVIPILILIFSMLACLAFLFFRFIQSNVLLVSQNLKTICFSNVVQNMFCKKVSLGLIKNWLLKVRWWILF